MQKHLANRLLIAILIFSSIVTFVLTSVQLFSEYRQELRSLDLNVQETSRAVLPSIVQTTWAMSAALQMTQVESLIRFPFIRYAAIENEDGMLLQEAGVLMESDAVKRYPLYYSGMSERLLIGFLVLQPDREVVYNSLRDRVFGIFITQGVKTFLISFFILYLTQNLLSRHLNDILEYIGRHLSNHASSLPLKLARPYNNDELEAITYSINKAKEELDAAYVYLRTQKRNLQEEVALRIQAEASLKQHSDHLVAILENFTDAVATLDIQGRIVEINTRSRAFLGLREHEPVPNLSLLLKVYLEDSVESENLDWQDVLQMKMPQSISGYGRLIRGSGGLLPLVIKIIRVHDDGLFVIAIQDQSHAARLEEVSFNATHDYLTGAYNRYGLITQINEVVARVKATPDLHWSLTLIDLDRFKQVNDTSGHQAGDELLRLVVKSIKLQLDSRDAVARLGGDEFAILMENTIADTARKNKDILFNLENLNFHWDERPLLISASFGMTPVYADDTESTLLARADKACYVVKADGGGAIQLQDRSSHIEERMKYEMSILQHVRLAIEHKDFLLYAQPIMSVHEVISGISDMTNRRMEILARLRSNSGGIISPADFFPILNQYAYTPKVDLAIFDQVARIIQPLKVQGWRVHINLSPITIAKPTNIEYILQKLDDMSLDYDRLCIEITEHTIIKHTGPTLAFMKEARLRGATFALDDFGSGYASFGSLREFSFEYIKLDGGLIEGICRDEAMLSMVRSIQSMSAALGAKTIAEHASSEEIHNALLAVGVDYTQGNYVAAATELSSFAPSMATLLE